MLWAFARAGRAAPELFEALGSRAMGRLAQHNTSDLAQITWAAAKAQDIPASTRAALLDATASELEQRLWECNAVALSMALYSFGVASHSAPGVFEAARRHVVRLLGDLGPHEAANIAWAYAKAEHRAPEVKVGGDKQTELVCFKSTLLPVAPTTTLSSPKELSPAPIPCLSCNLLALRQRPHGLLVCAFSMSSSSFLPLLHPFRCAFLPLSLLTEFHRPTRLDLCGTL